MCKNMSDDFENFDLEMEEEPIKSKTPAQSKTPVSNAASAGPRKNVFFKSTVGPERTEKLSVGENTPVRDVKDTLAGFAVGATLWRDDHQLRATALCLDDWHR